METQVMPTCWFFMVAQQNLFLVFSFFTFSVSHVQWFRAPTTRTLHAVGLLSKLYWSWFLFFYLHFLKEDSPYWYRKLSTPTVWILVSLVNWLIVETRWSAWPLKRILRQPAHSNRYYTIHQGTEKQRDITLIGKLSFKSHTNTGNQL